MKKLLIIITAAAVLLGVTGCGIQKNEQKTSVELFAMDTYMTLTAYGNNASDALAAAEAEIIRLDALLSAEKENSDLGLLNLIGSNDVSDESAYLLSRSLQICSMTDGAFNPLIHPLMRAWGFTDHDYRIPDRDTLDKLIALTDVDDISFNEEINAVSFKKTGMQLDFGGIAKGFTSERVIEILKDNGIESAVVSLGGNVQTLGKKPDGQLWKVAIRSPESSDSYIGIVTTADKAVITSGAYERFFEQDGVIYHHIIDPSDGRPAESDIQSSTVISSDGTLADGLSTALFVMGKDKAVSLWKDHSDEFDFVILTDDNELYVTEGIASDFSSELKVNIINR